MDGLSITTSNGGTVELRWADTGIRVRAGDIPAGASFSVDEQGRVWLGKGNAMAGVPGMNRQQRRRLNAEKRRGK